MATAGSTSGGPTVLISGGGIAGLTLAYWLQRRGLRPTVVERAPALRSTGYGIDFAGSGWDVAERMQIIAELRQRETSVPWFILKSRDGRTLARLETRLFRRAFQDQMIQIMRPDLEAVLYETIRDVVPIRFGATIQHVEPSPEQVTITLADGTEERYDLLIGADGQHSNVRRLVFGEERRFARYLGYAFATFPVPNLGHFEDGATLYLEPNRQATLYPDRHGGYVALLVYRAPDEGLPLSVLRKAALQERYQGAGWVVPDLIDSITDTTPIYLDTVTQICMPCWSAGRVALVGDAAHCLTLISGQGAATAMGGAYLLAEELGRTADHRAALAAYERRLRPFVEDKQRKARRFAQTFVPSSPIGVRVSHMVLRLMFTPRLARLVGRHFGIESLLPRA